ncbi:DUF4256 domain-containing protein [Duganella sp. Root1480D1]|uniref:DUF4256 domain-containing protein n=1 Tax=Duganella sp. Root1480D1 TaxID=1736471 RepID=UPI0007104512|nr:DUF4256 domain-containing protein [Duganella sp. Root1480D1]KQZ30272.1 hypothetical protein ASD58_09595 [Duganella sp. Root1480D1]
MIDLLERRFHEHMARHDGLAWNVVRARLDENPEKLRVLEEMERTGGEPDVVGVDPDSGEIVFCDCSPESPAGRRSLCFDKAALDARKENKPSGSALEVAKAIGITLLTEAEYRYLQTLGEFDSKTSSWVQTPADIRKLGGALFCDRRYGHVFLYHNGAESYYAARGLRGILRV